MKIDYSTCPERFRGEFQRYLDNHIRPGHFLSAVLSNDLMGAMGRADLQSRIQLHDICTFVYNHVPMCACGSKESFEKWLNMPEEEWP